MAAPSRARSKARSLARDPYDSSPYVHTSSKSVERPGDHRLPDTQRNVTHRTVTTEAGAAIIISEYGFEGDASPPLPPQRSLVGVPGSGFEGLGYDASVSPKIAPLDAAEEGPHDRYRRLGTHSEP